MLVLSSRALLYRNNSVKKVAAKTNVNHPPETTFPRLDKTNVTVDYVPISVTNTFEQDVIEDFEDYSIT